MIENPVAFIVVKSENLGENILGIHVLCLGNALLSSAQNLF